MIGADGKPLALCKWVGSKRGLLAARPELFPMPAPGCKVLVPFVGAGSVAAWYAQRGARVIASDADPRLVQVLTVVRDDVSAVLHALGQVVAWWRSSVLHASPEERETVGRRVFESVRSDLDHGEAHVRAARFLFVIRAGFNGLYRQNARGQCNTAYGKPDPERRDLVGADELRAFAAAIAGVTLLCEDFALTSVRARPGDAEYLDPPYFGTFVGYTPGEDGDGWGDGVGDDAPTLPGMQRARRLGARERLAFLLGYLDAIGVRWTLSDADAPATRELFGAWPSEPVTRSGVVSSKPSARADVGELVWSNWRPRPAATAPALEPAASAPAKRRVYAWGAS